MAARDPHAGAPRNWIVTLSAGADPAHDSAKLAAAQGGSVGHVFAHALRGFTFRGSAHAAQNLARSPIVSAVVEDRPIHAIAETLPAGVRRIDASHPSALDAHEAGFTGAGVSIGILDTGIDLDHPDLNVDVARGLNCIGSGPPEDGHGHGTHVAGTAAALEGNGQGVIGVASGAAVVPIKVLDDAGVGSDATVICGVDYVTGLATDSDPSNDIAVVNMSLGERGSVGSCTDGGLHQAICGSVAAGVTYVVAAGNDSIDAAGFVPAAYPEVITVSAMTDLDGEPGRKAGCYLFLYCDDGFAFFSDFGAIVDVIAPGVDVYSTWKDGGYASSSGTSMAAPHVAGVAALVRAANPALTPADVEELLKLRGECPDGAWADAANGPDCSAQSQWPGDPDGLAEPLVNALRAAQSANGWDRLPSVHITSPTDGASLSGLVPLTATATDDVGVARVAFAQNGQPIGEDANGADGWSSTWDTSGLAGGTYSLSATAYDTAGQPSANSVSVIVGVGVQGHWVGSYGANGYVLGAWNGSSDRVSLPTASLTLLQGSRHSWQSPSTQLRALESPDQSERRLTTWFHASQLRLQLTFNAAYSGTLHLYAVDGDTVLRRERLTITDSSGSRSVDLSADFSQGAWVHVPISAASGASVTVVVDRIGGANAVLSGIFLGGGGAPTPTPTPLPPPEQGVQGHWVGSYGANGYVLGAWNGSSDRVSLPTASLTLLQGSRHSWQSPSTQLRALESPDQSERRLTTWFHASQLRLQLTFNAAYSGTLHLYAVDGDTVLRRERLTVTDSSGSRSVDLSADFSQGAWVHVPISAASGASVTVVVDRIGGANAVLSGIFLGGG